MAKRNEKGKTKEAKQVKLPDVDVASKAKIPSLNEMLRCVDYLNCKPSFCFEFYDQKHKRFSANSIPNRKDFCLLFKRFKYLGQMTWRQIENSGKHAHEIIWGNTTEKCGFPGRLGETPQRFPPYQFQAFDDFRIIGFHQGNLFQIVWFDRNHAVDS